MLQLKCASPFNERKHASFKYIWSLCKIKLDTVQLQSGEIRMWWFVLFYRNANVKVSWSIWHRTTHTHTHFAFGHRLPILEVYVLMRPQANIRNKFQRRDAKSITRQMCVLFDQKRNKKLGGHDDSGSEVTFETPPKLHRTAKLKGNTEWASPPRLPYFETTINICCKTKIVLSSNYFIINFLYIFFQII